MSGAVRGLILAAGRGRRMGAATDALPKAMLPLHGRPLLAWQLEALAGAGVREVALVQGYRAEALVFDGPRFENPHWARTGIVASLARAEAWLARGETVVSYADLVYPAQAVRALLAVPGDVALVHDPNWLALWEARFADPLSDAETFRADGEGLVREIGGRPARAADVEGQYMGLLRLSAAGAARLLARFRALPAWEREHCDVTGLLGRLVREGEPVRSAPYAGWWCEVDGPGDLALAERVAATRVVP